MLRACKQFSTRRTLAREMEQFVLYAVWVCNFWALDQHLKEGILASVGQSKPLSFVITNEGFCHKQKPVCLQHWTISF